MNHQAELSHLRSMLAGITEDAKKARNRLAVTQDLVSIDANDIAQRLAIVGQEFHSLSVRMKQSIRTAAAESRETIGEGRA